MKTLYKSTLKSSTKFDNYTSDFDILVQECNTLRANSEKELLKSFFNDVIKLANYRTEKIFIYGIGSKYFKIPYIFNDYIIQTINNSKYSDKLKYTISDKKIKVFLKNQTYKLFETGTGSVGRVSTSHQEEATCIVWNAYIDALNNNTEFDLNDYGFIKNLVSNITSDFDNEWVMTFTKQVLCISDYLIKLNLNPRKYKLCRYGSKYGVGLAYKKYINSYTKAIGGRKDNFDPSDVIIYDMDQIDNIKGLLNSYCINPIENKINYVEELFNKHLLKGISLKKISTNREKAKYDIYNIDTINKIEIVKSYNIKVFRDTNLTILCEGVFNFDNITDSNQGESNNQKCVELVMRSFGAGQVGIDCSLRDLEKYKSFDCEKYSPTIGKCPARIWREVLNCNKNDNLKTCVAKFKEFLNRENIENEIATIIKGSIKEGPLCFPFVLIH